MRTGGIIAGKIKPMLMRLWLLLFVIGSCGPLAGLAQQKKTPDTSLQKLKREISLTTDTLNALRKVADDNDRARESLQKRIDAIGSSRTDSAVQKKALLKHRLAIMWKRFDNALEQLDGVVGRLNELNRKLAAEQGRRGRP